MNKTCLRDDLEVSKLPLVYKLAPRWMKGEEDSHHFFKKNG